MTTSQCSKSQPSSKIVSFGGRLVQFGCGSLSEEVVGRVEKQRNPSATPGVKGNRKAASGRRRRRSGDPDGRIAARERDRGTARPGMMSLEIRVRLAIADTIREKERNQIGWKNPSKVISSRVLDLLKRWETRSGNAVLSALLYSFSKESFLFSLILDKFL